MSETDEIIKWLGLGYETYGPGGARAMADAMGLDPSDLATPSLSENALTLSRGALGSATNPRGIGDPVSAYRHGDHYVSPNHRPRTTEINGSPTVRLYFWEPVGKGESSFGHLSSSVGDTMYSWGPGGMTVEPRETYLRRNRFRGALERTLRLAPEERQTFEESLRDYGTGHEYGVLDATCADPAEEALEQLGYPIGVRLTPKDLQDAVVATRPSDPDGYTYRKARSGNSRDKTSLGRRIWDAIPAPWSPLFEP